jgi:hypothetical protein
VRSAARKSPSSRRAARAVSAATLPCERHPEQIRDRLRDTSLRSELCDQQIYHHAVSRGLYCTGASTVRAENLVRVV